MRRRAALLLLGALGLLTAAARPYDPFAVPRDSVLASVRTIVLRPALFEGSPPAVEPVRALFDSLIAAELEAGGFKVVRSAEWRRVSDRLGDSLGGMLDTTTGEPDTARTALQRRLVMLDLGTRLGVDAVLTPHFDRREAPLRRGIATWDGVSQVLRRRGILGAMGSPRLTGQVTALSLVVELRDADRRLLYLDAGGLQSLVRLGEGSRDALLVEVPAESMYANPERNLQAVRVALAALTRRSPARR